MPVSRTDAGCKKVRRAELDNYLTQEFNDEKIPS
jgi:hypothetical protein